MKNLIRYFFITACLAVTSCHDDSDSPLTPEPLLTRIEENGVTALELIFDAERKLIRLNNFTEGDYSSYTLFEYGSHGLEESRRYDADTDVLENKQQFTLDNQGRITSVENYGPLSNFKEVISKSTFTYDASGRVLRKQYIFENNVVYFLQDFTYDANDHLLKSQWTYEVHEPDEHIGAIDEYTPGTNSIYDHLNTFYLLLDTSGVETYILEMFNVRSHHTFFDGDGEIVNEYRLDASAQQFNSKGFLTAQVLTRHNLFKTEADVIRQMSYEYIE